MNPMDRIARLRTEWEKATPAPWEAGEVFIWGHTSTAVLSKWNENPNVEPDAELIVRLRNAAEAQLDQLELALTDHSPCHELHPDPDDLRAVQWCHKENEPWPCKRARAALAVLDALDPEGKN